MHMLPDRHSCAVRSNHGASLEAAGRGVAPSPSVSTSRWKVGRQVQGGNAMWFGMRRAQFKGRGGARVRARGKQPQGGEESSQGQEDG